MYIYVGSSLIFFFFFFEEEDGCFVVGIMGILDGQYGVVHLFGKLMMVE